jgi:acyl carrier protein
MYDVQEWIADLLKCTPESLPAENAPLSEIDGWDSLRHLGLILGLEREINEKLTADQIKSIITLGDVAGILRRKVVDG